jgi:phosphoglycolate phosphatase-like HAD superfamily hydrolase
MSNRNFPLLWIFDWSGTLSDDRKALYETSRQIFAEFGIKVPEYPEFFKQSTGTLERQLKKEGINISDERARELFKKYFDIAANNSTKPIVYAQALQTVRRIHEFGGKIAIVSSHPEEYLLREAKEYGILHYVDKITAGLNKKSEALSEVCIALGIDKKDSIYVGDTIFDMISGKEAGIRVIGISHGYHSRAQLLSASPIEVVDSLTELETVFSNI